MKTLQKHLLLVAVSVGLTAIGMVMMNPHPASAAGSNPVQVVPNTTFARYVEAGLGFSNNQSSIREPPGH